ncbi:MAG: glycosyltransferase family 4 protein [Bacteroidetes bacterium]|nr:glycosyltransferase family 4 protein [Bacteroidota bacterium]
MPKVLRIINRFNLGGPTYNVAYLTKYLAPEFETLLIGGMKDESEASSDYIVKKLGIDPVIIPSMKRSINPFNDFVAYRELKKIIKDFKPDIVHTHAAKAGTLGRLAAFSCNVPVVVHTFHGHVFHSYFGSFRTTIFKAIERQLARCTTAIIAISDKQKDELANLHKIAPAEKIKVIPLGFDLDRFRENGEQKRTSFRKQYNIDDDEIAVGIIGRLVPVKNHKLFLQAIQYVLNNTTKKVRAFIIGDGEEKPAIIEQAKTLKLKYFEGSQSSSKAALTFTSWIMDVDWALAGLDILCLTSFNEGTPVSLIEAQAAGKPIVSTNVGGIENIVLEGQTALLAGVEEPEKYCDQLLKLVENDNLRQQFSLKGWNFVKEKFHYTRLISEMQTLYHTLLH